MNILFVCNYNVCEPVAGGIVRVTGLLARIFAAKGHCCSIAYYNNPSSGVPVDAFAHGIRMHHSSEFRELGDFVSEHSIDRIILQVPMNNTTRALFVTMKELKACNPALQTIHCIHQVPFAEMKGFDWKYLFFLLKNRSDKSFKEIIWGCIVLLFPTYAEQHTAKRYSFITNNIDKTVLLSEKYLDEYGSLVSCPEGTLFGVNNPVSAEYCPAGGPVPVKEKNILFVGRLHEPTKRLSILLRVWKKLSAAHPDWTLTIVGDGPERKYYEEMAGRMNLRNLHFEGIQKPETYYSKAAIFVNTSPCEGFPMTLIEAMQYGAVPVCFDGFQAVTDIIDDGINGLIVKYKDIKKYASALDHLIDDESFRNKLAAEAVRKVSSFSPASIYESWKKVLGC